MDDWKPHRYDVDPTVNALLNIAAQLSGVWAAIDEHRESVENHGALGDVIKQALEEHAVETGAGRRDEALIAIAENVRDLGLSVDNLSACLPDTSSAAPPVG